MEGYRAGACKPQLSYRRGRTPVSLVSCDQRAPVLVRAILETTFRELLTAWECIVSNLKAICLEVMSILISRGLPRFEVPLSFTKSDNGHLMLRGVWGSNLWKRLSSTCCMLSSDLIADLKEYGMLISENILVREAQQAYSTETNDVCFPPS